jgi:hypothetical protein
VHDYLYSSRSTYITSLQLQFCLFENNLRTGAMVRHLRHVNESLFWVRRVINYEIKRNTSSRLALDFYIKNYMSLCYSKPTHKRKYNYTIYCFLNKCFDQCQCSEMASRWSIYIATKYSQNFQTFAQMEVALYMTETFHTSITVPYIYPSYSYCLSYSDDDVRINI